MKTSYATFIKIMPFVIGALSVSLAHGQQAPAASSDVKWLNAPASLPSGAKLAILQGDLTKPGTLAFRLKLPAGYQLKPQSSPAIDRIIVVSGTFNFGSGEKFDSARTIPMSTGYVHWPDKSAYFGWTKEETVLEFQGVGPFAVSYVNAGDDPAKKKQVSSSVIR
ncbi:MAG: cupin domain-containing protein [Betaproteobacteria bacterium]|nr:cupin domain-containing protein [Betaproteobacteria bacterium]